METIQTTIHPDIISIVRKKVVKGEKASALELGLDLGLGLGFDNRDPIEIIGIQMRFSLLHTLLIKNLRPLEKNL